MIDCSDLTNDQFEAYTKESYGFTLYRVEADYVVPGEYAFGCGWICDTRLQAEALLAQLKDTRKDLCDLRIVPAHYGNPICD